MILETYTIEAQGITVSRLVWRRFRRPMPGVIEKVYDLNRGLADLPSELPVGTTLVIPVETTGQSPVAEAEPVQLWD